MLDVRPDPKRPRGGYAIFLVEGGALPAGEVSLTLRNRFNDKYLDASGWQSAKAYFGPYTAEEKGNRIEIVVGSEIVNLVEEYTPVTVGIGEQEFEVTWPDDILPGPPSAIVGGVSPTPPKPGEDGSQKLVGKAQAPAEPKPAPVPDTTQEPESSPQDGKGDAQGKRLVPVLLGVLAVALIGGGIYWYFSQTEVAAPPPVAVIEETEEAEPVAALEPCSETALAEIAESGFQNLISELGNCATEVSANTAFELLERGIDANDPAAIAAFGRLYDAEELLDIVETTLGLTYSDDPAIAAEYYARAVQAGDGVGAAEALTAVCARLATSSDTLAQGAFEDHCPE
ncbi:MAG: hypothetical protein AAF646_04820 [Pseudomonadota bacterium]